MAELVAGWVAEALSEVELGGLLGRLAGGRRFEHPLRVGRASMGRREAPEGGGLGNWGPSATAGDPRLGFRPGRGALVTAFKPLARSACAPAAVGRGRALLAEKQPDLPCCGNPLCSLCQPQPRRAPSTLGATGARSGWRSCPLARRGRSGDIDFTSQLQIFRLHRRPIFQFTQ